MEHQNKIPRWQRDLFVYLDAIPYGEVSLKVTRADRRTVEIATVAEETLRYTDNDDAMRDIQGLLDKLIAGKFTGEAHLRLQMKEGKITFLGVFDKKQTKY